MTFKIVSMATLVFPLPVGAQTSKPGGEESRQAASFRPGTQGPGPACSRCAPGTLLGRPGRQQESTSRRNRFGAASLYLPGPPLLQCLLGFSTWPIKRSGFAEYRNLNNSKSRNTSSEDHMSCKARLHSVRSLRLQRAFPMKA